MHAGVNTVEVNTEAASGDITEYPPPDDKPNADMFGFYITILCAFISSFDTYAVIVCSPIAEMVHSEESG